MRRSRTTVLEPLEDRLTPATLPTGFTESAVAAGLSSATAMEFAPNGDLWVVQQGGTVKRFAPGSTAADVVGSVSGLGLSSVGERGLLGLAFDPAYSTNKQLYLYYTATAPSIHNRISRFTVNDSNPADQFLAGTTGGGTSGTPTQSIIFELDALSSATNHNGGAIHFGPDGKLYAAVGDNAAGANAQTLSNLHGKMLRINSDGTIPTDNPFYTVATNEERAIWALGLRNPFTFSFQAGTGRMFINDVGQNTWEEINDGIAGSNYGWPANEGAGTTPPGGPGTLRQPLYTYSHGGGAFQGFAITGGAFYNPSTGNFPAAYTGDYFFADFVSDWINVLDVSSGTVSTFATGALGTVDLRVGNDGSLYYLARDANQVFRVRYTASLAPVITQQPADATVSTGGTATFTVAASGSGLAYQWQKLVGSAWTSLTNGGRVSGATSTTLTITTAAAGDAGQYRAVVSNSAGTATSNAATLTVTVNQPPAATLTITSGLTNGLFIAGQAVRFSGSATDPEDGTLGAGAFTWRVDYITSIASGNPVTRPFLAEFGGTTSSTFTPATTGPYTLTDVAYRVVLTVRDSGGLATTRTIDVSPNVSTITVTTTPTGLQVTVDGQPFTAPHSFAGVVGFERPIGAAAQQVVGGTTYNFASWSDGGAATHTIVTPLANTTYTAAYAAAPGFSARVNFQDTTSAGFAGYVADTGAVFGNRGNGYSYGWNQSNATTARNRNAANSPDERYDTLQHLQKPENPNAVWELAVPNGTYTVRVVSGDPSHTDSVFRTTVEGVLAINATPTTANRWVEGTVTVTVADGRLTVGSASGASNNKINFIEVSVATPVQQDSGADGLVAVEAERFDGNVSQGGKSWTSYTATAGYSGASALQATTNTGVNNNTGYVTASPRLDYRINFVKTGVHYVWVRGLGATGSDDSVHVGLDGQAVTTADRISGFGTAYTWTRSTMDGPVATINVTTPGVHVVNLWMREDGTVVDKLVLTTNANYTPTGSGPAGRTRPGGGSGAAASTPPAGGDETARWLAAVLERLEQLRRRSGGQG